MSSADQPPVTERQSKSSSRQSRSHGQETPKVTIIVCPPRLLLRSSSNTTFCEGHQTHIFTWIITKTPKPQSGCSVPVKLSSSLRISDASEAATPATLTFLSEHEIDDHRNKVTDCADPPSTSQNLADNDSDDSDWSMDSIHHDFNVSPRTASLHQDFLLKIREAFSPSTCPISRRHQQDYLEKMRQPISPESWSALSSPSYFSSPHDPWNTAPEECSPGRTMSEAGCSGHLHLPSSRRLSSSGTFDRPSPSFMTSRTSSGSLGYRRSYDSGNSTPTKREQILSTTSDLQYFQRKVPAALKIDIPCVDALAKHSSDDIDKQDNSRTTLSLRRSQSQSSADGSFEPGCSMVFNI